MILKTLIVISFLFSTTVVHGMCLKRCKFSNRQRNISSQSALQQPLIRPETYHTYGTISQASHTYETDKELFEKYGYGPDAIASFDNLVLSNVKPAENLELLKELGITHILNLTAYQYSTQISSGEPQLRYPPKFPGEFKYLHLPFPDDNSPETMARFKLDFLRPGHKFISEALQQNRNRVLVHCEAGISRSSTMVISYLMLMKNPGYPITLREAFEMVKKRKKNINPNNEFFRALVELESKLFEENHYPETVIVPSYSLLDYLTDSVLSMVPVLAREEVRQALLRANLDPNIAVGFLLAGME